MAFTISQKVKSWIRDLAREQPLAQVGAFVLTAVGLVCIFIPLWSDGPLYLRMLPQRIGFQLNVKPFSQAREKIGEHARTTFVCHSSAGKKEVAFDYDLYSKIWGPHRRKIYFIGMYTLASYRLLPSLPKYLRSSFCHGGEWAQAAGCPDDTNNVELIWRDVNGVIAWQTDVPCGR